MKTALTILGIALIGGLIWWFVARDNGTDVVNGQNTVCTMDAKLCPDGSYVGREGPQCEFRACPGEVEGAEDETVFDKG